MESVNILKEIINLHNLPGKVIIWLYLLSVMPFVVPAQWLERFLVADFLKANKMYIGIPFLILTPLVAINIFLWLGRQIHRPFAIRKLKKTIKTALGALDPKEKAVLREFLLQGNTVRMPIDEATVAGLIKKGIIVPVSTQGRISMAGSLFPVQQNSVLDDILSPEMLGITEMETDKESLRRWLLANRPSWIGTINREDELFRL